MATEIVKNMHSDDKKWSCKFIKQYNGSKPTISV